MEANVKEYWEGRAKRYSGAPATTTDDVYLRELEIATIIETLRELNVPKPSSLLDVGCGDGYSTLRVAAAVREMVFLGVDYSEGMVQVASELLESQPQLKSRVGFLVGDVTSLGQVCRNSVYEVVLSDRCLVNLHSLESQSSAIGQIAEHTRPGGYYIAIENFIEGHEEMNEARRSVGLPPIPVRWHNLYFREEEFVRAAKPFFDEIVLRDFCSSYYFATRVIYSAMCQMRGEAPDYQHEIHQLGVKLPPFGRFSPVRMAVMRRRTGGAGEP